MLATAALGAVWSSCSPDFGAAGVVDRFGQITPKVLAVADGYRYAGPHPQPAGQGRRRRRRHPRAAARRGRGLRRRGARGPPDASTTPTSSPATPRPLQFEQVPFDHPLFVMYSSGTTGAPKSIVHSHGGTLRDPPQGAAAALRRAAPATRCSWFTTCGWMMWNWLTSALAQRGGDRALRRLADASRPRRALAPRGARRRDALRHQPQVPRRVRAGGPRARATPPTSSTPADPAVDRLAAQPRAVRLGLRPRGRPRPRPAPDQHERRHRPAGLLRRRCPDPAGAPGRAPGARPGHGRRGLERGRPVRGRREGRAGLHPALPVDAGGLLGRPGRQRSTATPTSRSSPVSGRTATSSRSARTAVR